VEDFDEDTYDEDGLKTYIDDAIAAYDDENEKGAIKRKSLTTKDGKATLTLAYATAADYQKFTGTEIFTGSLAEALAAGYSFDDTFASVQDGQISACEDTGEFLNQAGYKVVIIRGNTRVKVKGTIAYVTTTNTTYIDASTIAIAPDTSIFASEGVGSTEGASEVVGTEAIGTESATETEEAEGSVSDDDLLSTTEDDTEMVFDFPDEESTTSDSVSQVYTYIIYK
jgi:hypothetical protein